MTESHRTPRQRTSLASTGDPEQDARNQLQFLRESRTGGVVYIPQSWVTKDPVWQQAVQELDWLRVEKPPMRRILANPNSRKPTTRHGIFDDETSEMGKARIAKLHRRLDATVKRLQQTRPEPPDVKGD